MKKYNLLAVMLLFTASLFAQIPSWVQSGKSNKFPDEFYWYAVGRASAATGGIDAAKNNARMEIASQMKVTVSGNLTTSVTEKVVGDNSEISSDLKKVTESVVDNMELPGLKIEETYFNKVEDEYCVFAVIEKEAFFTSLQNQLNTDIRKMRDKIESAKDMVSKGDIASAFKSYKEVLEISNAMYPKVLFYNSLAKEGIQLPTEVRYDNIEKDILTMIGGVKLNVVSGNNQKGLIGKTANDPIVINASYNGQPLKGVPVTLKAGNTILETLPTDESGKLEYTFVFSADGLLDNVKGELRAYITFSNIATNFRKKLENTAFTKVSYQVEKGQAVTCKIEMQGFGKAPEQVKLLKEITKAVEKSGVTINQSRPQFTLKATITSTLGKPVNTNSGTLYTQNVQVLLALVNTGSDDVIGTVALEAKGAEKSEAKALEKAIMAVKVPQNEISKLFANVK